MCAITAEPLEMPFGLWALMGRRCLVLDGVAEMLRDVAVATIFGFVYMGAHWRHLANTTEPSMCGGNAALCQITVTNCYY